MKIARHGTNHSKMVQIYGVPLSYLTRFPLDPARVVATGALLPQYWGEKMARPKHRSTSLASAHLFSPCTLPSRHHTHAKRLA